MQSNSTLAEALRATADRIEAGARYEWGHVGRCNCGHLVQTLTELNDSEIYRIFGQELTEWSEHARGFCETGAGEVEQLFATLHEQGMDRDAILHLEYLSDPRVLRKLPAERRDLRRNQRADVALYMRTLAEVFGAVPALA